MYDILSNIDGIKKEKIINAAIKEFSMYPFDKASTNNIIKNAGISKGLLFYYFDSKKELYEKLVSFVINKIYNEVSSRINWEENDILERLKQLVLIKMEISKKYPNMFDFILKVLSNNKTNKMSEAMTLYEKYGLDIHAILSDIYTKNIDYTHFKKPENLQKNINIIQWTLEKYAEQKLFELNGTEILHYDEIILEIDEYLDILKSNLYR